MRSALCGLEIPKLGEFLVFATVAGSTFGAGVTPAEDQLYAGLCGGTRATSTGLLAPELASPHPPLAAPPLAPSVDPDDEAGASAIAPLVWLAVATVGGTALALAVLLVRRRRSKEA